MLSRPFEILSIAGAMLVFFGLSVAYFGSFLAGAFLWFWICDTWTLGPFALGSGSVTWMVVWAGLTSSFANKHNLI